MIPLTLSSMSANISFAYSTAEYRGCSFPLSKNLENLPYAINATGTKALNSYYYTGAALYFYDSPVKTPVCQGVIEEAAFAKCFNLSQAWINVTGASYPCYTDFGAITINDTYAFPSVVSASLNYFDLLNNTTGFVTRSNSALYFTNYSSSNIFWIFNMAFRDCHNLHDIVFTDPNDNYPNVGFAYFSSCGSTAASNSIGPYLTAFSTTSPTCWVNTYFDSNLTSTQRESWTFNQSYSMSPMIWVENHLSTIFTFTRLKVPSSCITYFSSTDELPDYIKIQYYQIH